MVGQIVDIFNILSNFCSLRDGVSDVEAEIRRKHCFVDPHLTEGVE